MDREATPQAPLPGLGGRPRPGARWSAAWSTHPTPVPPEKGGRRAAPREGKGVPAAGGVGPRRWTRALLSAGGLRPEPASDLSRPPCPFVRPLSRSPRQDHRPLLHRLELPPPQPGRGSGRASSILGRRVAWKRASSGDPSSPRGAIE